MYNKRFIFLIQISALIICASAFGQPAEPSSGDNAWDSVDSNYFVIYYHPAANLEKIERDLQQRTLYFDQAIPYGEVTVLQEICYRMDKLFNRVKEILDMYPRIEKIKIKIFKDRNELNEEYFNIFGSREDIRSFYINKYDTIYTSESGINDSIMIHEMAHVIIDHYFAVIPPERVREILASYVDAHLEK